MTKINSFICLILRQMVHLTMVRILKRKRKRSRNYRTQTESVTLLLIQLVYSEILGLHEFILIHMFVFLASVCNNCEVTMVCWCCTL